MHFCKQFVIVGVTIRLFNQFSSLIEQEVDKVSSNTLQAFDERLNRYIDVVGEDLRLVKWLLSFGFSSESISSSSELDTLHFCKYANIGSCGNVENEAIFQENYVISNKSEEFWASVISTNFAKYPQKSEMIINLLERAKSRDEKTSAPVDSVFYWVYYKGSSLVYPTSSVIWEESESAVEKLEIKPISDSIKDARILYDQYIWIVWGNEDSSTLWGLAIDFVSLKNSSDWNNNELSIEINSDGFSTEEELGHHYRYMELFNSSFFVTLECHTETGHKDFDLLTSVHWILFTSWIGFLFIVLTATYFWFKSVRQHICALILAPLNLMCKKIDEVLRTAFIAENLEFKTSNMLVQLKEFSKIVKKFEEAIDLLKKADVYVAQPDLLNQAFSANLSTNKVYKAKNHESFVAAIHSAANEITK